MVDIHCHILPGVDDGSPSLEHSLQMARMAVREGIGTVIATPHHANGKYDNPAGRTQENVKRLTVELKRQDIPLQVCPGQEVRVYSDLISDMDNGSLFTLNGSRYLLIEFPSHRIPPSIKELIHELKVMQITPILAHPERNKEIAENPAQLFELIEFGVLCQLTSHSITGLFGPAIRNLSLDMCRRNWIHFISSDAHNVTQRPFSLREAYAEIDTEIGSMYSSYYQKNAKAIIENQSISICSEPIPIKKKWYRLWS